MAPRSLLGLLLQHGLVLLGGHSGGKLDPRLDPGALGGHPDLLAGGHSGGHPHLLLLLRRGDPGSHPHLLLLWRGDPGGHPHLLLWLLKLLLRRRRGWAKLLNWWLLDKLLLLRGRRGLLELLLL